MPWFLPKIIWRQLGCSILPAGSLHSCGRRVEGRAIRRRCHRGRRQQDRDPVSNLFIYFYFVFLFKLFLSKNISSLDFLKIILKKKKCSELGSTTEVFPPSSTPYYRRQPTTGQRRKRRTNPQTNSPNHPSSSIWTPISRPGNTPRGHENIQRDYGNWMDYCKLDFCIAPCIIHLSWMLESVEKKN